MARLTIRTANPELQDNQTTQLVSDVASGATSLTAASMTGFPVAETATATTYYYAVIGRYGEETTEIVLISNNTDTVITTSALKFSHSASDPITYIAYNQVKFYGLAESGGTPQLLETSDIDCSDQITSYDYTGVVYSIFVTSYYRAATTAEESAISDEITTTTFTFNSAKKIIEAGVRKALTRPDENPDATLSWSILIDLLNEGLNEIMTSKKKWQCLHTVSDAVPTVEGVAYIEKPTDLSILEFIMLDGNKVNYITKMRYDQYITSSQVQGLPCNYTIKNDQVYFYPTPNVVKDAIFEYYAMPTEIVELSDTVKKEFATILIYFIAAQASYIRNNEKRGNLMELKFQQKLASQIEDVTGWEQMGDAEEVEMTSIYGPYGDNDDMLI